MSAAVLSLFRRPNEILLYAEVLEDGDAWKVELGFCGGEHLPIRWIDIPADTHEEAVEIFHAHGAIANYYGDEE